MSHRYVSCSADDTRRFARSVADRVRLRPEWGRIILLSGELGAGKTTFTKAFFEALGSQDVVKSPTFTYFQRYETDMGSAIHGDLYRLSDGANTEQTVREQLDEYAQSGEVMVLEWADLLGESGEIFAQSPCISIDISRGDTEDERILMVSFGGNGNIPVCDIADLMDEYQTPVHVRHHIFAVTGVAHTVAQELIGGGVCIDPEMAVSGALCHDLVRYVDFPNFDDPSKYEEEVTEEKLRLWKGLKAKYETTHHGAAIADILRQRGYFGTALVAENHMTGCIMRREQMSWEEKVVWYADKRALHDRIVSLAERFEDGRKRYGYGANADLEQRAVALEAEIFENIAKNPEDIGNTPYRV